MSSKFVYMLLRLISRTLTYLPVCLIGKKLMQPFFEFDLFPLFLLELMFILCIPVLDHGLKSLHL